MHYAFEVQEDAAGGYIASFPDVAQCFGFGLTVKEAREDALRALVSHIDQLMIDRRPIPMPRGVPQGSDFVALSKDYAADVLLYQAHCHGHIRTPDLDD